MPTVINGTTGTDKVQDSVIAGHVIQVSHYHNGTATSGTATIPADNTIPQNIEGTQFMSLSFTPKKANSLLRIDVNVSFSSSIIMGVVTSLFRDSVADSIGVSQTAVAGANYLTKNSFTVFVNASSVSLTTFNVRMGGTSASTIYFNSAGTSLYGGTLASSITITEIAQ